MYTSYRSARPVMRILNAFFIDDMCIVKRSFIAVQRCVQYWRCSECSTKFLKHKIRVGATRTLDFTTQIPRARVSPNRCRPRLHHCHFCQLSFLQSRNAIRTSGVAPCAVHSKLHVDPAIGGVSSATLTSPAAPGTILNSINSLFAEISRTNATRSTRNRARLIILINTINLLEKDARYSRASLYSAYYSNLI